MGNNSFIISLALLINFSVSNISAQICSPTIKKTNNLYSQTNLYGTNQSGILNISMNSPASNDIELLKSSLLRIEKKIKSSDRGKSSIDYHNFEKKIQTLFEDDNDQKIRDLLEIFENALISAGKPSKELADIHAIRAINDDKHYRFESALFEINKAIELNHLNVRYAIFKANMLHSLYGQSENGFKLLESYLNIVSDDTAKSYLYSAITNLCQQMQNFDDAEKYMIFYSNVCKRDNYFGIRWLPAYLNFRNGNLYFSKGDFANAINDYDIALEKFKINNDTLGIIDVQTSIGECLIKQKKFDNAEYILKETIPKTVYFNKIEFGKLYRLLGDIYLAKHQYKEVSLYFEKALHESIKLHDIDKICYEANLFLWFGIEYEYNNDYQHAETYYNKAIEKLEEVPELNRSPTLIYSYDHLASLKTIRLRLIDTNIVSKVTLKDISNDYNKILSTMESLNWIDMPLSKDREENAILLLAMGNYEQGFDLLNKTEKYKYFNETAKIDYFIFIGEQFFINGCCEKALVFYNIASSVASNLGTGNIAIANLINIHIAEACHGLGDLENRNICFNLIKSNYKVMPKKEIDYYQDAEIQIRYDHYKCRLIK